MLLLVLASWRRLLGSKTWFGDAVLQTLTPRCYRCNEAHPTHEQARRERERERESERERKRKRERERERERESERD